MSRESTGPGLLSGLLTVGSQYVLWMVGQVGRKVDGQCALSHSLMLLHAPHQKA